MKGFQKILLAGLILLGSGSAQVLADPFIGNGEQSSSRFHGRMDDFGRSLGEAGQRMRESYDGANSLQAQRNFADQNAIQQGTQAMAQQEFERGMMQAQASGGLYNGNGGGFVNNGGLFGSGIGVFNSNVSPDLNYRAGYQAGMQATHPFGSVPGGSYPPSANSVPLNSNSGLFGSSFGGESSLFGAEAQIPLRKVPVDPNWKEPVPVHRAKSTSTESTTSSSSNSTSSSTSSSSSP